jgi:hypothetical protein
MNLAYLRPLFARPGPWASVYLDATRAEENAEHQVDLRWRALRERLESQGAPPDTLAALDDAVAGTPSRPGRYGLALFATGGDVVLAEALNAPPPVDLAEFGPLPHAMPLVAQRGAEIPYVRVESDRTGAEVTGLTVGGVVRRAEVRGTENHPLTKVHAGGWSDRRYDQAVEETWKRNAGDVAAAVAELATAVGAEVVVIGGDVRSTGLTAERLPKRWRDRVVTTDRAGETDLDEATVIAVAEVAERQVQDAIDRYEAQRGSGAGSEGLADVVIGPGDPSLIADEESELRESGIEPIRVRADQALLRAIVGTDAELVLVQPGQVELAHEIGAILRYNDGDTAAT